ncbi:MAG: hypothetical protein Q4E62_07000 [Sutterellaceae bacterium]|nr:hypothetical protein [Sutterellaceae bacterium]
MKEVFYSIIDYGYDYRVHALVAMFCCFLVWTAVVVLEMIGAVSWIVSVIGSIVCFTVLGLLTIFLFLTD